MPVHPDDDEVVQHLQALLRLDTRNPPGNENLAADYLRSVLARDGIDSVTVGPSPDRASLVARLRGDSSAPPLLLMSHTDVVAVERDKWTQDPFGGDIVDGFIYGRGALDMKHMVAMELQTMLTLRRRGVRRRRRLGQGRAGSEEQHGVQHPSQEPGEPGHASNTSLAKMNELGHGAKFGAGAMNRL